jgi:hypothetical protein
MLDIHGSIKERLQYFKTIHKIPNIIFHGPSGCGKRTLVKEFIQKIYDYDRSQIKSFAMYVNCAHGKGIKFIRDDLKFFAKTHINSNNGDVFKSIILMNADKLTMDAQSALRRCIELFSHNTRFFIIVENKYSLLKPILSRFCEIYVPEPIHNGSLINLYKHNLEEAFQMTEVKKQRQDWLKKELTKPIDTSDLFGLSSRLYEHGYSGIDLVNLLENPKFMDSQISIKKRYELLVAFNKVRREFRNEKLLLLFILNFLFMSLDVTLENISFM